MIQLGQTAGPAGRYAWPARALDPGDPWLQAFREAAHRAQIAVALTYRQRWPGAPRNTATIIDRHSRDVLTHAKVHSCDWVFGRWLTPGETFPVASLDTPGRPVRAGVMICFDREVPEASSVAGRETGPLSRCPSGSGGAAH